MKNVFLIMIFACMLAFSAEAQTYFAGGSIGVDYEAGKGTWGNTTTKNPSTLSFEFSPMAGYYLSDKLGAGARIVLGGSTWNSRSEQEASKNKTFRWGFGPFLRYTVLTRGDFSVLIEGGAGIFGESSKETSGTTTNDGPKVFGFDIDVMPILSYSLTDRVSLEARTNLARFGFSTQTEKRGTGESQSKESDSAFGFGVDSFDFFRSPYQIGMIFKF